MRIDTTKKLRDIAGEHIVIRTDGDTADMTTVVGFNESALLLYRRLAGRDFTVDDATRVLCDEYDIAPDTARRDADAWVASMRQEGLLQ